jgi:hypothetical protein
MVSRNVVPVIDATGLSVVLKADCRDEIEAKASQIDEIVTRERFVV